jgi:hypothetical protein
MRIQILTRDSDEDEIAARRCSRGRKQDESFTDPTHCTEHPIKAYSTLLPRPRTGCFFLKR